MHEHIEDIEFERLLAVAYLALDEHLHDEAQRLFTSLVALRLSNPHPRIGLALVSYNQHDVIDAIDRLESVLDDFPNAVFTRSLLARFMYETGRDGWQQMARDSLTRSPTGVAADLARYLLAETEPVAYTPDSRMQNRFARNTRTITGVQGHGR